MAEIEGLIDGIYEAGVDPSQWLTLMERLADTTGGFDAVLGGLSGTHEPVFLAPRTDPDMVDTYVRYYHTSNPLARAVRAMPKGMAALDHELVDMESLHGTPFYNDWCVPQGLHYGVALTIATTGSWSANLVISGSKPFDEDVVQRLQFLSPHLTRAFHINQVLHESRSESLSAFSAMALVDRGVFLIGENQTCEPANKLAEFIVGQADALRLHQGRLECVLPEENRLLHRAIHLAATGKAASTSATIRITRGSSRQPLQAMAIPLPNDGWTYGGRLHRVMVFVTDQEARLCKRLEELRQDYRLTLAETAVLQELTRGGDRTAIAVRLGVSLATVRTQLTSIFDKTGVRRQADIVRLVMDQG